MRASLFGAVVALGAACGGDDDGGGAVDAGGTPDAPDAAGPPSQTGEILLVDTAFNGYPELGYGPVAVVGPFKDVEEQIPPVYEEAPGSPFACKVWEYTPEQYADKGHDIGTVNYTVDQGGPEIPSCSHDATAGYTCVGMTGAGGAIAVVDVDANIYSLSNAGATFGADEVGRYVLINDSAEAGNNGMFPIVAADGDNTIHYVNPLAVAEETTAATYSTILGLGPAGQTDPIADNAKVTVQVTGAGKFEDFNRTVEVGDSFTLDDASRALISDLPLDGSGFEINCDGEGGTCGPAMATALNIEATDGAFLPGMAPGFLPPPETKYVRLFCLFLIPKATVPAAASQYLADSGATRIRTLYVRAMAAEEIQTDGKATLIMGHGVGGFTSPAQ